VRPVYEFLCFDPFAGRADEDELFWTHSEFSDRAEVVHDVAAGKAHDSAGAIGHPMRTFDGGDRRHVRLHETGGSATELSAADAWHRAAVGGEPT
jgi:hypothetical protein